jgi:hypothetical protein
VPTVAALAEDVKAAGSSFAATLRIRCNIRCNIRPIFSALGGFSGFDRDDGCTRHGGDRRRRPNRGQERSREQAPGHPRAPLVSAGLRREKTPAESRGSRRGRALPGVRAGDFGRWPPMVVGFGQRNERRRVVDATGVGFGDSCSGEANRHRQGCLEQCPIFLKRSLYRPRASVGIPPSLFSVGWTPKGSRASKFGSLSPCLSAVGTKNRRPGSGRAWVLRADRGRRSIPTPRVGTRAPAVQGRVWSGTAAATSGVWTNRS